MTDSRAQAYALRSCDRRLAAIAAFLVLAAAPAAEKPASHLPADPLVVEVSGSLAAPLAVVREILLDLDGFRHWFPSIVEWRILERFPDGARVYGRQSFPWPVADRDYVVRYRAWDTEAGGFVLEARALVGATPAARDGVLRLEAFRTLWTLTAEPTGTRARYRYEGPRAGPLRDWLLRVGSRSRAVIDGLADEIRRRDSTPDSQPRAR